MKKRNSKVIRISKGFYDYLVQQGCKSETFEAIIKRLIKGGRAE
jgi:hypothetical protein